MFIVKETPRAIARNMSTAFVFVLTFAATGAGVLLHCETYELKAGELRWTLPKGLW